MSSSTKNRMHLRVAAVIGATALIGSGIAGPSYAANGGGRAAEHQTSGTAGTSGDVNSPQPQSRADRNGTGANQSGPYDSTRDGSPSRNGNGGGEATGKPCAGCVGKADNKNPRGQYPGGSDRNAGYECDRNHGIGRGNPAHTGCTSTYPATEPTVTPSEGSASAPTCSNGSAPSQGGCTEPGTEPAVPVQGGTTVAAPAAGSPAAGSPAAGSPAVDNCPLPMSSGNTTAGCTAVAGPMLTTGAAFGANAVAAPAVDAPSATADRGAASISDAVADVLPQTGAAALMFWAALAGLLLAAAGGLVLHRSRIRA